MASKALILVRGLPGSGKSTLAKELKTLHGDKAVHLEADQFFIDAQGNYIYDVSKLAWAHHRCETLADAHLSEGKVVIVSNTFTVQRDMKAYFLLAKKHQLTPHVILCQTQYENIHNVPPENMKKLKHRMTFDLSPLFDLLKSQ